MSAGVQGPPFTTFLTKSIRLPESTPSRAWLTISSFPLEPHPDVQRPREDFKGLSSSTHRLESTSIRQWEPEPKMGRTYGKDCISLPPLKKARKQEPRSLCDACTHLFSHQGLQDLNSSSGFAHKTRQGLRSSARAGCDLCKFVYEVVFKQFGHRVSKNEGLLRLWNSDSNTGGKSSHINALVGRVDGSVGSITLYPFVKKSSEHLLLYAFFSDMLSQMIPSPP